MQGLEMKSGNMTMSELITMSKELQGLRSVNLTDEGNFVAVMPKQIIRDGANGYLGLPELVMAEEFANIPVTLEKDYVNYKLADIQESLRGVFNYDLNKHLIENLLNFRTLIGSDEWMNAQTEEVKERLYKSKFFGEEDGKRVLKQKALLAKPDLKEGDIISHIKGYTTEIVFYADPQVGYKLEPAGRMNSSSVFYRVDSTEEAASLGVEKGSYIPTPWLKFVNHYNAAFNKIYLNPIRERYPNISNSDFKELPEVEEANKNRLVNNPVYKVITLVNRIKTNLREEIEIEAGGQIPTFLNTMQMKSYHFEKYFKFDSETDVHFEPSMAILKLNVPKREGDKPLDYRKQYDGLKSTKPEVTLKNSKEDARVPNLHPNDTTYSKRMKEEMLNFPFKQAYVTSNSKGFGAPMKLAMIYEIMRNIGLPMYQKLEDGDFLKDNMGEFLTKTLQVSEEDLKAKMNETDGQFSGSPSVGGPQPAATPTAPTAPAPAPVPPVPPLPPTPQA